MNVLVIIKNGGVIEDLDDQLKKCHEFARSKEWNVTNVVINELEVDILKEINNASSHIDVVLATDMTRVFGSLKKLGLFLKTLKDLNLSFYSLNEGELRDGDLIDPDDFNGTNA